MSTQDKVVDIIFFFLPCPVSQGPPLPGGLGVKWPWYKEKSTEVNSEKLPAPYKHFENPPTQLKRKSRKKPNAKMS